MSLHLTSLLASLQDYYVEGNLDRDITSITNHSGEVKDGSLFICIPGIKVDGHDYADAAVKRGAAALVVEKKLSSNCTQIIVKDAREAQAWLSHAYYGDPSHGLEMIGVTGTNGKTTTTYFIESILNHFGQNAGRIGTINYKYGNYVFPSKQTTPDSISLHKILEQMVQKGTKAVVMEVSSHGLAQKRVAACDFDVAILSNVTHDHFDYHTDFQDYLDTKASIFEFLNRKQTSRRKFGIINIDDANYDYIARKIKGPFITYGVYGNSEVKATNIDLRPDGSSFDVQAGSKKIRVNLQLPGLFNIYNALAALTYGWGRELDLAAAVWAVEKVWSVPGRCQQVDLGQDFTVVVDFAHNPDGLKNILDFAPKPSGTRRIVVFGCEGGKDKTKRQVMGHIAGNHSDYSIITMDNLYAENPHEVAMQIELGLKKAGRSPVRDYSVILDRSEAIKEAINMARTGDQVIIAGKGHETTQTILNQIKPFCDWEVAAEAIQKRFNAINEHQDNPMDEIEYEMYYR